MSNAEQPTNVYVLIVTDMVSNTCVDLCTFNDLQNATENANMWLASQGVQELPELTWRKDKLSLKASVPGLVRYEIFKRPLL